ncbi:MAG: capsular biosynthesis protein [Pseudomonadota bacterium]|nr:capsular biosynthesis protein [Pseudomonadota bacterium]
MFYPAADALDYRGTLNDFAAWLAETIERLQIDAVVCFGDCRRYHERARPVCQQLGTTFLVFEEGYLRPDYVTLECDGVNAHSNLNLDQVMGMPTTHDHPQPTNPSFSLMVWSACLYYLAWMVMHPFYPHYQHHRLLTPFQEIVAWLRALRRRLTNTAFDHYKQRKIRAELSGKYFIIALQVHNDSQIRVHSDYEDASDFLVEAMHSFAAHANPAHALVIKHHPMDRGYRNYRRLIQRTARALGIEARVIYVCDVHLPSLIKRSIGLVTINSTTGLQALFHGKPVKAMGRAIYNQPRLTFQGDLAAFWTSPEPVDQKYYWRFRTFLIRRSQLNGSFYGQSPWMTMDAKRQMQQAQALQAKELLKQRHG